MIGRRREIERVIELEEKGVDVFSKVQRSIGRTRPSTKEGRQAKARLINRLSDIIKAEDPTEKNV